MLDRAAAWHAVQSGFSGTCNLWEKSAAARATAQNQISLCKICAKSYSRRRLNLKPFGSENSGCEITRGRLIAGSLPCAGGGFRDGRVGTANTADAPIRNPLPACYTRMCRKESWA